MIFEVTADMTVGKSSQSKAATKQSFGCCTPRPDLDNRPVAAPPVARTDEHPGKRRLLAQSGLNHRTGMSTALIG